MDLLDLFRGDQPLSPKFVLAHIKYLPIESAFVAELRGGQKYRGWGEDRYQRATLINEQRSGNYMFKLAHASKKANIEPPKQWPLPDFKSEQKKDKPGSFAAIAKGFLARSKRKRKGDA